LVNACGAKHTADFMPSNTHLICKFAEGKKYEKALEWCKKYDIKVVNPQWLYDVIHTWTCVDTSLDKYTVKDTLRRKFMLSECTPAQRDEFYGTILRLGGKRKRGRKKVKEIRLI
jgi:hypothetical protein